MLPASHLTPYLDLPPLKLPTNDQEFEWFLSLASCLQAREVQPEAPAVADAAKESDLWPFSRKRSESVIWFAKRFPATARAILTLSIRGLLPPLHEHWLARSLAPDLFADRGFPMWGTSCRLRIPRSSFNVYLGYMDLLDHEPLTRRALADLLRPGAAFLDVGANVGYYTLLAAGRVGPRGQVHAVECSAKNLAVLSENVRNNNLHNVKIHPFAASSQRGLLTLSVSPVGLSTFRPNSRWLKVEGLGEQVTVPCVPLDEIVRGTVDVAKIDAEGAELEVLQGMSRILAENEYISIVVEWAPPMLAEANKDPMALPRYLQAAGFTKITVVDQLSNRRIALDEAIKRVNSGQFPAGWVADLIARKQRVGHH